MTPDRIAGLVSGLFLVLWFVAWILWPLLSKKTNQELVEEQPSGQDEMPVEEEHSLMQSHIKLHVRKALLESQLMRMRIGLQLLVNRLDQIDKDESLLGVFHIAELHGVKYEGPTWGDELAAAKKLLEEINVQTL